MEDTNNPDVRGVLIDVDNANGTKCKVKVDEHDIVMGDSLSEDFEPESGMSFPSQNAVKSFYKQYARRIGFKFKIRNSRKGWDGNFNYFVLACTQEGNCRSLKRFPAIKNKCCQAKITVSLKEDGLWYIMKVVLDHSHELRLAKEMTFRVNKYARKHVKRTIEITHGTEPRINKTFQSLIQEVEGSANLSLAAQGVRDYVKKERNAIGKEGDGKALRRFFSRMQEQDSNFFYDIDFDDNFQVKSVLWADGRSRATYDSFGDVVTFDTTCLANKYDMPLVSFIGVNHHGQSVLFGCGLLSSEDIESFVWLFQSWLRCMSGNPPKAIVTDQCVSIQNAILLIFRTTWHRWCLWHIMKKIPEKLKSVTECKIIQDSMESVVYDASTEAEFEDQWDHFINKFDLQDNQWLSGLYNERHRWVPIFLKKDFWAGMSTTQRSENMHTFFDGYINSVTSLQQFIEQYDNILQDKAKEEFEADFKSFNTTIRCESNSLIEKQFQSSYTPAKFYEVQAEFRAKIDCSISVKCVKGNICIYDVLEDVVVGGQPKEAIFEVIFYRDNHDVSCKCCLFEFRGILCRHSLVVLAQERVKQVPSKYILPRWSKNVEWRHVYDVKSSYDVTQLKPQMQRYDNLCKDFYEVAKVAAEFEDVTDFLQTTLRDLKGKVQSRITTTNISREDEENEEISSV